MNTLNLAQIRERVAQGDRASALRALREAIMRERISGRDGIEVMLAVRQGSPAVMEEAITAVECGPSGAYRFVPKVEHAFA